MSELVKRARVVLEVPDLAKFSCRKVIVNNKNVAIVSVQLLRVVSVEDARDLAELTATYTKEMCYASEADIVALSARAPIYYFMMVAHHLGHVVPALAVFDPKLRGIVVVESHRYDAPAPGTVLELPEELVKELTQA